MPFDFHVVNIDQDDEQSYPTGEHLTTQVQKELRKIRKLEPDHSLVEDWDKGNPVPWFRVAYHYHIPVVHVNGEEIARHSLEETILMNKLAEAESAKE